MFDPIFINCLLEISLMNVPVRYDVSSELHIKNCFKKLIIFSYIVFFKCLHYTNEINQLYNDLTVYRINYDYLIMIRLEEKKRHSKHIGSNKKCYTICSIKNETKNVMT